MALDPSKSADLVVFHFTDEVQQIISELQVSQQNSALGLRSSDGFSVWNRFSLQDDQLLFQFLSCLLEPW